MGEKGWVVGERCESWGNAKRRVGGGEEGMGCRRKGVGSEREGMAVGEMQREGCVK